MKKIKVLHLCDKLGKEGSSIHGVSQLFSWWWPLFDKNQFELELAILRSEEKSSITLRNKGVPHHELHCNKFNFFSYKNIVAFIKEYNIDILHAHGYGSSNIGLFAAYKTGIDSIIHEHFVDPAYPFYQKPFDLFLAKKANKGIAVSESVKTFMINQRCIPKDRIEVIYCGAQHLSSSTRDKEQIIAEKQRLEIPLDKKVIATIGRLDEQKGNCYFLQSAKKLLTKGYKVHFVLFGDGPLSKQLKHQCEEEGIASNVTFTGFYNDIALAHALIDLQVFPSLWEGTPLTLFEAFSFGTPIVSTRVDGLGEIIEDEKTGLLMPAKNVEKMTEQIIRLLEEEDLAKRLADAAKNESKKYDVSTCVKKMEHIYHDLLSQRHG